MADYIVLAAIKEIKDNVFKWLNITIEPHRHGGDEFKLEGVEIGHIHDTGMLDILFNTKIREVLVDEKKAFSHPIYPDSGWVTLQLTSMDSVNKAIWLLHLSYLFRYIKLRKKNDYGYYLNVEDEIRRLKLSNKLKLLIS